MTTIKMQTGTEGEFERDIILQAVHDIRSPLTVLKILLARFDQASAPVQRELISAVFQRIEEISADLLSQCRSTPIRQSLPTAVRALILEKAIEYGPTIQIKSTIDATTEEILVEGGELKRALSNLINNSVEAGAKSVQVEVNRLEENILISICDDGGGIPDSIVRAVQCGGATSERNGHGFGLFHAKNFAASMKGYLSLRSVAEVGACVTLNLPASAIHKLGVAECGFEAEA